MSSLSALPYEPAWVTVETFRLSNPLLGRKTFTHRDDRTQQTHTWHLYRSPGPPPPFAHIIFAFVIGLTGGALFSFTLTGPLQHTLTPTTTPFLYGVVSLALASLATATVRFRPTRFTFRPLNADLPSFTLAYDRIRREFRISAGENPLASFPLKVSPFNSIQPPLQLLITLADGQLLHYFRENAFATVGFLATPNATRPIAMLTISDLRGPRLEVPSGSTLVHPALAASLLYLNVS